MQLPTDLQHFPKGALLVASDSVKASFYLLGGDALEELDGLEFPHERAQDAEGPWTPDENDEARMHAFIHAIVERIDGLVADHAVHHVHLVMPAEIEHAVSSHLPESSQSLLGVKLHVDLMKEAPLDIVRRVVGEMGHAA